MPVFNTDKVIVTNLVKLGVKYGTDELTAVKKAAKELIDADAGRGLKTVLVDLSSPSEMKKYTAPVVSASKVDDPRTNKRAIDLVYKAIRPAYLLLLGATDVIPHQDLKNPVYSALDDTDVLALSDLPYACDSAYSQSIRRFLTPDRVVGRLPDVNGGTDVGYLLGVLKTATEYQPRPAADYDAFLGITAEVWQQSTEESLRAIFGTFTGMKTSPVDGPNWTAAELRARAHFVNCHGALADWRFYGQRGSSFPTAHDASLLAGRVQEGSVLAAECCYGAELFDPALTGGQQLGMCNTYLGDKAYAFFGSSTIAYGPAAGNSQADLICQYFLKEVRAGASVGRACLQARLDYVQQANTLTPIDLKTLAQFNLMADPAVTPVKTVQPASHILATSPKAKTAASTLPGLEKAARFLRRATLGELSKAAITTVFLAVEEVSKSARAKKIGAALLKEAARRGMPSATIFSFAVDPPTLPKSMAAVASAARMMAPQFIHSVLKRLPAPAGEGGKVVLIDGFEAVQYDADSPMEVRAFSSR